MIETGTKTDMQYKDELRKELIMYREYIELLNSDPEKLKQRFQAEIDRIQASLQD